MRVLSTMERRLTWLVNVTLEEVRCRMKRTSYKFVSRSWKIQKEYVDLYKRSKGVTWLSKLSTEDKNRLSELEDELFYDDIILFVFTT